MCACVAGCARTEGYYKISYQEKSTYLVHTRGVHQADAATSGETGTELDTSRETKKKVHLSREARSESRRWLSILSSQGEDYGDLLKFNQLKVRKRQRILHRLSSVLRELISFGTLLASKC